MIRFLLQFYAALLKGLGLENEPGLPGQNDQKGWPWMKARLASIFLTKTRDEWATVFRPDGPFGDACVAPVLSRVHVRLDITLADSLARKHT